MTSRLNSADRKAARFGGFDVRGLDGYRVVPDKFGMFELRVTGVVSFEYNSQTERHDIPRHEKDYCWSIHNSPKTAVGKAHWHSKWVKKHLEEMAAPLPFHQQSKVAS